MLAAPHFSLSTFHFSLKNIAAALLESNRVLPTAQRTMACVAFGSTLAGALRNVPARVFSLALNGCSALNLEPGTLNGCSALNLEPGTLNGCSALHSSHMPGISGFRGSKKTHARHGAHRPKNERLPRTANNKNLN
jgi:hypothetical protein